MARNGQSWVRYVLVCSLGCVGCQSGSASSSCPAGEERCACGSNYRCFAGLECRSGICVSSAISGSAGNTNSAGNTSSTGGAGVAGGGHPAGFGGTSSVGSGGQPTGSGGTSSVGSGGAATVPEAGKSSAVGGSASAGTAGASLAMAGATAGSKSTTTGSSSVRIAASRDGYAACAIRSSGELACWGASGSIPSGTFTSVAMGTYTCVIDTQGVASCLGGGAPSVPTDRLYRAIMTAGLVVCGIPVKRSLECWPNNYFATDDWGTYSAVDGAFGAFCALGVSGSLTCRGDSTTLVPTVPTGTYSAVSVGYNFACAVNKAGALVCWGTNAPTPTPTGTFIAVSAGRSHVCAIKTDHTVACWGPDSSGETQPPSGTFAAIAAGNGFTCGIRTDGSISCWGKPLSSPSPSGSFLDPKNVPICTDGDPCSGANGQSGVCYAGACCTGCFYYNACEAGTDAGACGLNGSGCNACPGTCGGGSGCGTPRGGAWSSGVCNSGVCGFGEPQCCPDTGSCGAHGCS